MSVGGLGGTQGAPSLRVYLAPQLEELRRIHSGAAPKPGHIQCVLVK